MLSFGIRSAAGGWMGRPGAPDLKPLARSVRAPGQLRDHARTPGPAVSRAFSGALSRSPRASRAKKGLRCCAHFALAERQHDARSGIVRSSLPLLFAANPGKGFAQVRVDTLRVAE